MEEHGQSLSFLQPSSTCGLRPVQLFIQLTSISSSLSSCLGLLPLPEWHDPILSRQAFYRLYTAWCLNSLVANNLCLLEAEISLTDTISTSNAGRDPILHVFQYAPLKCQRCYPKEKSLHVLTWKYVIFLNQHFFISFHLIYVEIVYYTALGVQ